MTFFSLQSLGQKAGKTFLRFPLAIVAAIAGTVVGLMITQYHDIHESQYPYPEPYHLFKYVMSCYLVMLLSISVSVYAERFNFSSLKKNSSYFIVILVGVLYFYSLHEKVDTITTMRFTLFVIGLHLLVSFVPFIVRREINGVWQFNRYIFIRILEAALYSGVLFAGLAFAMLAIENLFDIKIKGEYYWNLWFIIIGIFNTWFFLAGVPQNTSLLENDISYPKGLKVFTVYVLLPLVCLYLVILYTYAAKILITSKWPEGWIAYLVIAFSIFGILSFLLIHPLRNDDLQKWVRVYSRLFYFLLLPLIVLLFAAIFKRINMYGITEERYFVMILACWLSFISVYMIVTGGKNIRAIPVSLCIVAFLSSFGPWSAFNVSRNSQVKELTSLLERTHILKNGLIDTAVHHKITYEDYSRVRDILTYIHDVHGSEEIRLLLPQNPDSVTRSLYSNELPSDVREWYMTSGIIIDLMQVHDLYEDSLQALREMRIDSSRYFNLPSNRMINSAGYDFVNEISISAHMLHDTFRHILKKDTISVTYSEHDRRFYISFRKFEPLSLDAGTVLDSIYVSADPEKNSLSDYFIEEDNRDWKAKIVFTSVNLDRISGRTKMTSANGVLFVKLSARGENEVGERRE